MKTEIIQNLFELWDTIGQRTHSLHRGPSYRYVAGPEASWPSRIYDVVTEGLDVKRLASDMKSGGLPQSLAIEDHTKHADLFRGTPLRYTSGVRTMALDLDKGPTPLVENPEPAKPFIEVQSSDHARIFSEVASAAFGYPVARATVSALLGDQRLKMYLHIAGGAYAGCGLLFLDSRGHAGLHMIGTHPGFRGQGLGRAMSVKLRSEAMRLHSQKAVLVASQAGERIYTKLGFKAYGTLHTYILQP